MSTREADLAAAPVPAGVAELLGAAAREAGALALRWFRAGERTDARIWTKCGNSPVTEADIEVDSFLRERLGAACPDFGWLSEETADSLDRLSRRLAFVVDPIDGTRGFLGGDPRWCVSIAVVADGVPVAAVVHAPALGTTHEAIAGGEARLNGAPIRVRAAMPGGERVAGPRSMLDALEASAPGIVALPKIPSLALRLCHVADGSLDIALASRGANDWDIAAAHLIIERAGGKLADFDGNVPRYNLAESARGHLLAAPLDAFDGALARVRRALGLPETAAGVSWHA